MEKFLPVTTRQGRQILIRPSAVCAVAIGNETTDLDFGGSSVIELRRADWDRIEGLILRGEPMTSDFDGNLKSV